MKRFEVKDLLGVDLTPRDLNFVIEYSKDFNASRAAVSSGLAPDTGYAKVNQPNIQEALSVLLSSRIEASHIDAEWVLMEAVDNHRIARQMGQITASNTALNLIAKHTMVDALASDKLNMNVQGDKAIMERLMRGRQRALKRDKPEDNEQVSFL